LARVILAIDDDPAVLDLIKTCLRNEGTVRIANNGQTGLRLARRHPLPDLILLDVSLPDFDGYDICAALKQDVLTADIPVIFLSSHSNEASITHGLAMGAVDYVTKPVQPAILRARVKTHLRLRESSELLHNQNAHLELLVNKRTTDLETRTAELQVSKDLIIFALGSIAETRDNETGNHIQRTLAYVQTIAERLAPLQCYRQSVAKEHWSMIWKSSPLHDIGKVGIPDSILLKPGKLTAEEFLVMQRHPVIGRDALHKAEIRTGSASSFLAVAKEIAYAHHERWDGSGYPEGLSGESIPLSARLMALADVYDALTSKRVYKPAWSHKMAMLEIRDGRGKHFDPSVVNCFLEVSDEFRSIALRFRDEIEEDN